MPFKEVTPEDWKPEKEDESIEGVLLLRKSNVGPNNAMLYLVETKDGIKNVWGSAILDSRMLLVKDECKIRITYKGLGEAKAGQNAPKIFKVETDEE